MTELPTTEICEKIAKFRKIYCLGETGEDGELININYTENDLFTINNIDYVFSPYGMSNKKQGWCGSSSPNKYDKIMKFSSSMNKNIYTTDDHRYWDMSDGNGFLLDEYNYSDSLSITMKIFKLSITDEIALFDNFLLGDDIVRAQMESIPKKNLSYHFQIGSGINSGNMQILPNLWNVVTYQAQNNLSSFYRNASISLKGTINNFPINQSKIIFGTDRNGFGDGYYIESIVIGKYLDETNVKNLHNLLGFG